VAILGMFIQEAKGDMINMGREKKEEKQKGI